MHTMSTRMNPTGEFVGRQSIFMDRFWTFLQLKGFHMIYFQASLKTISSRIDY